MLNTPNNAREKMYMYTTESIHFHNIKVLRSKPVCEYATPSLTDSPIHCKVLLIQELQTISCQPHITVPTTPLYVVGYEWAVQMDPTCGQNCPDTF